MKYREKRPPRQAAARLSEYAEVFFRPRLFPTALARPCRAD